MTLNSLVTSSPPFGTPGAGFDYFATRAHYRSLASRIITALGGFNVVVVTGDVLSSAPTLSIALGEAAAGRYTVIGLSHGPEQDRHNVLRFRRALSASLPSSGTAGEEPGLPAVIVFDDTNLLPDEEIEEIFEHIHQHARIGNHWVAAAVFLSRPEFLTRLDKPVLRFWLAKRLLVARLRFHELGADEIPAFIYNQLPSGEAETIFTNEAVAAVANVSGGDPMTVNRFLRRMLDAVSANAGDMFLKARVGAAAGVPADIFPQDCGVTTFKDRPRQDGAAHGLGTRLSTRKWHRRSVTLKLYAGTVFCFACVAVVAAVVHMRPTSENLAASSSAPARDTSTTAPAPESVTGGAVLPGADIAASKAPGLPPEEPTAVPAETATALGKPTPEASLTIKMSAPPPSPDALRSSAGVAAPTEAPDARLSNAVPAPAASPSGLAPPTGAETPKPKLATSLAGPPLAQLHLADAEIAALVARGDALLGLGDISSARLFYERAADAGDGRAALRLGKMFDPVFLVATHLRLQGDVAMAVSWYRRALELGEIEAETPLNRLVPVSSR